MDINIDKTPPKSFENLETTIGKVYLFTLRIQEIIAIEKKLKGSIEKLSSEELLKLYLPFFSYLEKDLSNEELKRPDNYTLKKEEIDKLSKDELEEIAKLFLNGHTYLYEKKYNKELLKNKDESYIDYFYRVILEEKKRNVEHFKTLSSTFSSTLSNDILKTVGIGESLKNTLASLNKFEGLTKNFTDVRLASQLIKPAKVDMHMTDHIAMIRQNEEKRLAPFKNLSSKMDKMIEAEQQTVSFMGDVYKTQIDIAQELKTSSDSTNEHAKLNIKYTKLIIGLTIFSILITVISFSYSIWFDNDPKKLIQTNENINSSVVDMNSELKKLTESLIEQNKIQNKQIKDIERKIDNIKIIETKKLK